MAQRAKDSETVRAIMSAIKRQIVARIDLDQYLQLSLWYIWPKLVEITWEMTDFAILSLDLSKQVVVREKSKC